MSKAKDWEKLETNNKSVAKCIKQKRSNKTSVDFKT